MRSYCNRVSWLRIRRLFKTPKTNSIPQSSRISSCSNSNSSAYSTRKSRMRILVRVLPIMPLFPLCRRLKIRHILCLRAISRLSALGLYSRSLTAKECLPQTSLCPKYPPKETLTRKEPLYQLLSMVIRRRRCSSILDKTQARFSKVRNLSQRFPFHHTCSKGTSLRPKVPSPGSKLMQAESTIVNRWIPTACSSRRQILTKASSVTSETP